MEDKQSAKNRKDDNRGLSTGQIVSIVVGVIGMLLVILLAIIFYRLHKNENKLTVEVDEANVYL